MGAHRTAVMLRGVGLHSCFIRCPLAVLEGGFRVHGLLPCMETDVLAGAYAEQPCSNVQRCRRRVFDPESGELHVGADEPTFIPRPPAGCYSVRFLIGSIGQLLTC